MSYPSVTPSLSCGRLPICSVTLFSAARWLSPGPRASVQRSFASSTIGASVDSVTDHCDSAPLVTVSGPAALCQIGRLPAETRTSLLACELGPCGSRGPPCWSPQPASLCRTMASSPNGSPLRAAAPPYCACRVWSAPWLLESAYMNASSAGANRRFTVGAPNGLYGTTKVLNSPPHSTRRSPPVLAISTSRPAPP